MTTVRFASLALGALLLTSAAAATPDVANNRFKDVQNAVAEGYAPIPCVSGLDGGAMGIDYVNPKLLASDTPDIRRPDMNPTVSCGHAHEMQM